MRLLAVLLEFFVNTFQITRPRPENERQAQWIIGGLTLLVLVFLAALTVGMLVWPSAPDPRGGWNIAEGCGKCVPVTYSSETKCRELHLTHNGSPRKRLETPR